MKTDGRKLIGGLVIALGIIFLLDSLFDFNFWHFIWKLWPLVLIVLGIYILKNQELFGGDFKTGDFSSDSRLFGDLDISLSGKEILNHRFSTLMGNIKLDLTGAEFKAGETKIGVSSLVGKVRIKIPDGIPVKLSTHALKGDIRFDDLKRDGFFQKLDHIDINYVSAEKKLLLGVSSIIGDLDINRIKIDDVN